MSRRNERSRKRPRPQSPTTERQPPAVAAASNGPRPIPGFVWDADKQQYFPAAMRPATSSAQRDERRETQRIQQVELTQKQLAISCAPALPFILRQRSLSQQPVPGSDRLRFARLGRCTPQTIHTNAQSAVSALAIASCGQRAVTGHRDGSLWRGEPNAPPVALSGGPGEIVSIRRVADRLLCAHLGDEHSGGGLVAIAGSSRLRYADCSVFTASAPPPPSGPLTTAVGLTGRVSVAAMSNARMAEVFSAQTKTDVMSTAFALDSPHVFAGGGRDGCVRLFDVRVASAHHHRKRGLLSATLTMTSSVHGVGAQGWRVVAVSMDSAVRMWDVRMPDERHSAAFAATECFGHLLPPLPVTSPFRLGFAVCQDLVAAAASDNQIRVWSMSTGNLLHTVALPPSVPACTAMDLVLSPTHLPTLMYSQLLSVVSLQ
ncbi:hypothetical protein FBU31_004207 [Coemansia sp. 'formosensis']|nr:hypothetical protein FBU31_004207 [Coemansia sp. 'formosensis']